MPRNMDKLPRNANQLKKDARQLAVMTDDEFNEWSDALENNSIVSVKIEAVKGLTAEVKRVRGENKTLKDENEKLKKEKGKP